MYLYTINIYTGTTLIKTHKNLSRFGFFQKNTVSEFMDFMSKTLIEETLDNTFSVVKDNYKITVFRTPNNSYSVITDLEYPDRLLYQLYNNLTKHNDLEQLFKEYSNPEIDKFTLINKELDETKQILHKTIENVLNRGSKLDDLINATDDLSNTSKIFYKQSKKMNSCCVIL